MKRDGVILTWAYAVEFFLVGAIYGVMLHFAGANKLIEVMEKNWPTFSTIAGVLFASGLAAFLFFAQLLDSEFGKYLKWRKADGHYLRAYQVQVLLFLLAAGIPAALAFGRHDLIGHGAWVVFLYACVNGLTVVRNTVQIVRLRQKFQVEHDAILAEIDKDER